MKKNNDKIISFKGIVIGIIVGLIVFIPIGNAVTDLYSLSVDYDNSNSTLSSSNVQDAIDELYQKYDTSFARDYSDTKNHGKIYGATKTEDGLNFDGVDDYILVDNVDYQSTTSFTIDFEAKVEPSDLSILFESSTNSNDNFGSYYVDSNEYGTNDITLAMKYGSNVNHKYTNNIINTSEFHHYTITFSSTNSYNNYINIYLDAVLQSVTAVSNCDQNISNNTLSNYPLYIGSRAGNSYFTKMILKNFKLYTKELNSSEIVQNNQGNIVEDNLILYFKFV